MSAVSSGTAAPAAAAPAAPMAAPAAAAAAPAALTPAQQAFAEFMRRKAEKTVAAGIEQGAVALLSSSTGAEQAQAVVAAAGPAIQQVAAASVKQAEAEISSRSF